MPKFLSVQERPGRNPALYTLSYFVVHELTASSHPARMRSLNTLYFVLVFLVFLFLVNK
jgi:hypothetical protein